MKQSPLLPFLFLACSSAKPPERYGLVATLGKDTVSVERMAPSPTRLVSDGVDRWPLPTIDDPAIPEEISADLAAIGYPRNRAP